MGTPLVIDDERIKKLRMFAEAHIIPIAEMYLIQQEKMPCAGDREGHVLNLDFGFKLVYSIEEHPHKNGKNTVWLRHMSMSVATPGRIPNPVAVQLIAEQLGFPSMKKCQIKYTGGGEIFEVLATLGDERFVV